MNIAYRKYSQRALLFLIASLIFSPAGAQKLATGKTTVDVGRTGWKKPITAVFEFRTKGRHKLRIEKVVPDCFCTTVDYPKGDVGETFQIRMTYDAKQLGHFNKQAAVYTNASKKPVYITMKGHVLEHYVDLTGSYPVVMGDLRLDKGDLEFDDINRGDQRTQQLRIYNNSTQTCQPRLMHLPPYLSAQVMPETMTPGDEGVITVTLNSTKLHDYGLTQTSVYLGEQLGDKVSPDHEIGVSAVLLPSFTGVQNLTTAPRLQLSADSVKIAFEGKAKGTTVIELGNTGHSDLKITSLQMFTRGLRISLGKSVLKPGEYTRLKITVIAEELQKVRTRPRILMITNDPHRPKVTITIDAK